MRAGKRFQPGVAELEGRVFLSRGASVAAAGLASGIPAHAAGKNQSAIAMANRAFDSFLQNYSATRTTYFSTLSPTTTTDTSTFTAFKAYTANRLNLLAQQIISGVMTTNAASARNGNAYVLPGLVARKINGVVTSTGQGSSLGLKVGDFLPGTLGSALVTSTPANGTSSAAASLDALAQDQAIEATRISVINGLTIIRNSDFGTKTRHK